MAFQQLPGSGLWVGCDDRCQAIANAGGFRSITIDATGEKVAFIGWVWFSGRTGTKDIRRVHTRFGTVTKAGGSGLTLSLQNVNAAAGPPWQPDETQDQTVAIANGAVAFATDTWHRSDTLSADRTVSFGEMIAVVVEFDGSGRQGADAVNITGNPSSAAAGLFVSHKTGGTWAAVTNAEPNVLFEFSDGSFGGFDHALPATAFTSFTFNSGSAGGDEHALPFSFPFPVKIDGLKVMMTVAADQEVVLYEGTTALQTVTLDANVNPNNSRRTYQFPIPETELDANTTYYLAVKPTTVTSASLSYFTVDAAGHLALYPGGTAWSFTSRVDGGAWDAVTATRQLCAGVRVSSVDDGAGGGTPGIIAHRGMVGGFTG